MKTTIKLSIPIALIYILLLASCTNVNKTIQESNTILELEKSDFELSDQVVGSAVRTQVFGIDFKRIFKKQSGNSEKTSITSESPVYHINHHLIYNLPIIGNQIHNKAVGYALFHLLDSNPGYDIIIYPQYKIIIKRPIGLGFIWRKTEVEVKARLGKLK